MDTNIKHLIPDNFSPESKVWIFQSDRRFNEAESADIGNRLALFEEHWNAHGVKLHSFAALFFNQFIVLMADGSVVKICGGSTDASTRFMKKLEDEFSVRLLDRHLLAFMIDDNIRIYKLDQIGAKAEAGVISEETLYFNNTILTKDDLLNRWIVPVRESWLANRIPKLTSI